MGRSKRASRRKARKSADRRQNWPKLPNVRLTNVPFWELSDALFTLGPSRPSDVFNYANQLGLDQTTFKTCVESRKYSELVSEQLREAFEFRGTPSYIIDEIVVASPPSYKQLSSITESILTD